MMRMSASPSIVDILMGPPVAPQEPTPTSLLLLLARFILLALIALIITVATTLAWVFSLHPDAGLMLLPALFFFSPFAVVLSLIHTAAMRFFERRGPLPSMALAAALSLIPTLILRVGVMGSGFNAAAECLQVAALYGFIAGLEALKPFVTRERR